MPQEQTVAQGAAARPLRGIRRLAYWIGRILQGLGLLLIWWVLLLFVGFADMWTLLFWSLAATLIFYTGWLCTAWAKQVS
jgi:hypothetical protein